jgi:hypothetical protein
MGKTINKSMHSIGWETSGKQTFERLRNRKKYRDCKLTF